MPSTPARDRFDVATTGLESAIAIVEMAAFDANAGAMTANAAGKPLRVASKSVRCHETMRRVRPGWHGVLAYTLPEAFWLVREGVTTDAVVGYPTADRAAIARLAADPAASAAVTIIVDAWVASGEAERDLRAGDRVWFRHAKVGEVRKHINTPHAVAGSAIKVEWPTYRGEGQAFL
jgi:D-serine deaminase-like pyridoxal phosphate-dependent protein